MEARRGEEIYVVVTDSIFYSLSRSAGVRSGNVHGVPAVCRLRGGVLLGNKTHPGPACGRDSVVETEEETVLNEMSTTKNKCRDCGSVSQGSQACQGRLRKAAWRR